MNVTSEMIVAIAGVVLSLLFSYIPGLRVWYAGLVSEKKQLIMLGLLALVSGGIFALGRFDILEVSVTCDKPGAISLIFMLVSGIVANQATYLITPAAKDAALAKDIRDQVS